MVTDERLDRLASITSPGGVITDENRFDRKYLLNVLNTYRVLSIQEQYRKERKVANAYQEFEIYKDEDFEGKCISLFKIPEIISIAPGKFGFNYVGSADNRHKFNLVLDRGTAVSNTGNRILRMVAKKNIQALYLHSQGILEVDSPDVERMKISAALFDPTSAPNFNFYENPYPIDDGMFDNILDMLQRGFVRNVIPIKPDRISNSAEDVFINPQSGK